MLAQNPGKTGLRLLTDNIEAFALRAAAARNAERSLDLQYYYWKDDLTGGLLAEEVIKAADRGVRVRLLLDDINAWGRDSNYRAVDTHPNVEVRLFNPIRCREGALLRGIEMILRFWSVNRRMHNKAWIADGRVALVGGRNIGDAYFDASEASNFRDMDLMVLGPAVQQAEKVFDRYWNSAMVAPIRNLAGLRRFDLGRLRQRLQHLVASERAAALSGARAKRSCGAWHDVGPRHSLDGQGRRHFRSAGEGDVRRPTTAGCSTPSFRFSPRRARPSKSHRPISFRWTAGQGSCSGSRARASRSRCSPTRSPQPTSLRCMAAICAFASRWSPAASGFSSCAPRDGKKDMSLFGSRGASLHTKAFVVDGLRGFVGSFNFDPRSVSLNTEMGILFEHAELARRDAGDLRRGNRSQAQLQGDAQRRAYRLARRAGRILDSEPDASLQAARRWRR